MSGHSHARTIKHKKEATDAQRSRVFSKLAREIAVATRMGDDPQTNAALRSAIEKARGFNMPSENIERALKRATAQGQGVQLQELVLEAYGPGGIPLLITAITDNKNRTISQIKQILEKFQGKLAQEGSVRWMFERKGVVALHVDPGALSPKQKEGLELAVIEGGAEDFFWKGDEMLEAYTKPDTLSALRAALERQGLSIDSSVLEWVPRARQEKDPQTMETAQKLFDALDQEEDVQDIYSNLQW